tara:strand:- start:77 stop:550 length:474 start_codon:yes stop_codon:yes gene_type:complete
MTYKTKILKRRLLTEIKNYKRKYTIYKLVCNITSETYYGSTCQSLKERLSKHKCQKNCSSKIIIDRGNYLPLIPLETNLLYCEKIEREEWYINNNVCVNKRSAKFTVEKRKQVNAKWNKNNKEKIVEYYQKNKKYKKQCDYWRNTSPIGILSRAYFD